MERPQLISDIKQLFHFHKQATAFDGEYTDEMYDFLVAEGKIVLTKEAKLSIFVDAKRVFSTELSMQVDTGDLEQSRSALTTLRNLKMNKLSPEQNAYLGSMCKKMILKRYFNSIETLTL